MPRCGCWWFASATDARFIAEGTCYRLSVRRYNVPTCPPSSNPASLPASSGARGAGRGAARKPRQGVSAASARREEVESRVPATSPGRAGGDRQRATTKGYNKGPYGEYLYGTGYVPLTGYTGHIQTEPNGLIYMRGRFYSPAWHVFLNSDQGADPNSYNQYAYAGGNPFVNVDPSGMSWLSKLLDPLGLAHSARVNWNHGRKDIEIGIAAVVCIVIDIASDGTASDSNEGIMEAVGGAVNAAGGPVVDDAAVGAAAGGAIGGTWRSAAQGALLGASLGYAFNCVTSGDGFGTALKQSIYNACAPPTSFSPGEILTKMAVGGIFNTAVDGGSPWNNFRNGALEGAVLGGIGYDASGSTVLGWFGNQAAGVWAYRSMSGDATHLGDFAATAGEALGYGLTGSCSKEVVTWLPWQ
jgi:RHS repeat-associated protein